MNKPFELAIIGAGPAGIAAALEAAQLGIETVLIDSAPAPGGQYFRQTPAEFDQSPTTEPAALFNRLAASNTLIYQDTTVWGIFPENGAHLVCLFGPEETPRRIVAKTVILAPGTHERPFPFPGWTLPSVMTLGAALILVKHQHILPGRRVLVSGTGPLQWVLAQQLIEAGAEMVRVLDANPFPWQGWRAAAQFWGQGDRLREGWEALQTLRQAGEKVHWGQTVLAAQGENRVESASIGRTNGSTKETLAVDTLCLGFGFVPAVQLSRQAGCDHQFEHLLGGWVPVRDEWLETTVSGIFAAGDGAGIRGKDAAASEGQLAALGAARALGKAVDPKQVSRVNRKLDRQRRFAAALFTLFPTPGHGPDLLTDDTIICRCEGVTVKEVRRRISEGADTLGALRKSTRAGMGRCQGRFCGLAVADLLARQTGQPVGQLEVATPRPPVMPIPLHGLAENPEGTPHSR